MEYDVIQARVINGLHFVLCGSLFLSFVFYFLTETGTINSFPTYFLAIACLALLIVQPRLFVNVDKRLLSVATMLLLYLSVSSLWMHPGSLDPVLKHLGYSALLLAFLVSVPLAARRFESVLYRLVVVTLLAAFVSCCYSIYLHYALPDYQPLPEPRLFGLGRLSNPVISATSYGFAVVLAGALCIMRRQLAERAIYALMIPVFCYAILLSGSRAVWPALFVGLSTGILLQFQNNRQRQVIGVGVILFTIVVTVLLVTGLEELSRRAFSFRPQIWTEFVDRTLTANWLLGAGFGSDTHFQLPEILIEHPHSLFVATFYYGGLIAILGYLLLLFLTIQSLINHSSGLEKTIASMLLGFGLVVTLLDGDKLLTKINYLWFVIWFPVGLALLTPERAATPR